MLDINKSNKQVTDDLERLLNISEELRQIPQWVCWKSVDEPGQKKPRKVPINPVTGNPARPNDLKTCGTFDDATEYFNEWKGYEHTHVDGKTGAEIDGKIMGVGFVFSRDDDFVGIDLDNCFDENGILQPWAAEIVEALDSYTEVSPSGTGLHIIAKGDLPSGFHKGDVEAYCHGRYFTFTGNIYQNLQTIHHRQGQLTTFWNDFSGKANLEKQSHTARVEYTNLAGTIDAKTVLRRALRSKNGEKIQKLLNDERLEHHTSDSERDLALCSHLTFYCGNVPDDEVIKIVDEIVRNHPVYRKKWDTIHRPADDATYGQMTIEKAIEGSTARYLTHVERNLSETEMVVENMERLGLKTQDIIEAAYDGQKGCANLFALMNRGHFCYDHADRDWYQFNCHYWKIENIGEPIKRVDGVQMFFKRVSAEIDAEITLLKQKEEQNDDSEKEKELKKKIDTLCNQKDALYKLIHNLNYLAARKQVVEFSAQGQETLGIAGNEWDKKPWELACKNGIVDLRSGKLRPGYPEDYLKSPCPTEYDPQAECPQFELFLLQIFGDDQTLVAFVQRVFGMALIGDSFQKQYLIILSGQGRNGKDTLLSIIGHVLGSQLSGPIAPEMLLDTGKFGRRSSSGPSPDIMRLRGRRIAYVSETSQGRQFDAGEAKRLTGGGALVGRVPYGRREVEFNQSHLIFLLTNHRPHAPVDDYAFWKRICNIPFSQSFVDDPKTPNEHRADKNIVKKMHSEASGILRWMIDGCLAYQRDGLNPPETVNKAGEDYRRSEDTLLDFIDEECIIDRNESCPAKHLYDRYKDWAKDGGIKPMTQTAFGRQIVALGFKRRKSAGVKIYDGIRLNTQVGLLVNQGQ